MTLRWHTLSLQFYSKNDIMPLKRDYHKWTYRFPDGMLPYRSEGQDADTTLFLWNQPNWSNFKRFARDFGLTLRLVLRWSPNYQTKCSGV
jgi:hypothetical protein